MNNNQYSIILFNQVCRLNQDLQHKDCLYKNAKNLTNNLTSLIDEYKKLYPRIEFNRILPHYDNDPYLVDDEDNKVQIIHITNTTNVLEIMLRDLIGNPIVQDYLSDSLNKAEDALKDDHLECACIMTRVALEQALKFLCEMKGIDISNPKPTAGTFAKALRDKNIFYEYYYKNLQSKISYLSDPAHRETHLKIEDVKNHILWVSNFCDNWLSGKDYQKPETSN